MSKDFCLEQVARIDNLEQAVAELQCRITYQGQYPLKYPIQPTEQQLPNAAAQMIANSVADQKKRAEQDKCKKISYFGHKKNILPPLDELKKASEHDGKDCFKLMLNCHNYSAYEPKEPGTTIGTSPASVGDLKKYCQLRSFSSFGNKKSILPPLMNLKRQAVKSSHRSRPAHRT